MVWLALKTMVELLSNHPVRQISDLGKRVFEVNLCFVFPSPSPSKILGFESQYTEAMCISQNESSRMNLLCVAHIISRARHQAPLDRSGVSRAWQGQHQPAWRRSHASSGRPRRAALPGFLGGHERLESCDIWSLSSLSIVR